jgi:hypothetical protein
MNQEKTALVRANQLSISDIKTIGQAFAASGFFSDARSEAQAIVKIMAGQELGISPFSSMSGISVINGKLVIGSNIMAGKVKSSGKYDYKIPVNTNTEFRIDFYQGKELLGSSVFTMEDAAKAGLNGKAVWKNYPKNMLFARAMSNGIRFYCPDLFLGLGPVYTPEEMDAEVNEDGEIISTPTPAKRSKKEKIEEDFKAVKSFQQWTDTVAFWLNDTPSLESNAWFQKLSDQYKPHLIVEDAEDADYTENTEEIKEAAAA